MSQLTDETRTESVAKLRAAADLLERGEEKEAGKVILAGLKPGAKALRAKYGFVVRMMVGSWVRSIFEEE